MNAQEIIDYIANSEKKTPVKLYVNLTEDVDFGSAKVYGTRLSQTVFGDWEELRPILEASADIAPLVRALNQTLRGRGGGRNGFAQGGVSAAREDIEKFFQEVKR